MIYLNGQQIENIAGLSTRFQVVLSMIQGGTEWLIWDIKDKLSPAVNVTGEEQLLGLIQEGLHEDDYIRFNTFRASLSKILTLTDADAEQLAVVRKSANDNETNLRVLLQRNQMLSYGDIAATAGFITSVGAGRPDLFQAPSFEDLLRLAGFLKGQPAVTDAGTDNPAYTFALGIAATIPEFIYLSLFYQEALQQLPQNLTPLVQSSKVQVVYGQLLPAITYLLFTPNAGKVQARKALMNAIPDLARSNQFIGYSTTAAAVLNLARNINISDQPDQELQSRIINYLAAVKKLVSFTPATDYTLSQDGALATLRFEKDQSVAVMGVDDMGKLFIMPDTKINNN